MGYTPEKKAKKKRHRGPSTVSKLYTKWLQVRPVLFFVLGFAVLMVIFYIFWLSDYCQSNIQPGIVTANAKISSFILNLFGLKTVTAGGSISSESFSVSIAKGCDAMEAMALFASALLAFPAKWKFKLIGFFAGIAMLFTLNLGRIVSLFITGLYYPKAFEIMHVEVWQVLFIVFALGIWVFWIKWTRKEAKDVQK
jgi:exosortase H (IPTLxxWG-CTERM-specific)